MDVALIATRTAHFAAAISLPGLFGFVALIAGRMPPILRLRLARLGWIGVALLFASAPPWLLFVAQSVNADSISATIASGAAMTVFADTQFGHVMVARLLLALALLPCVAMLGRRRTIDCGAAVIAAISLALIAWQGHGGADLGSNGAVHLAADIAHLIAAGLWLGALLPLALLLRTPAVDNDRAAAARRFSTLGLGCVGVLLVSGAINAWYLVGSVPALIGTPYGQLLLTKLALIAAMLWFAAINRWRLLPRLASGGEVGAARRIARHATIEAVLGLLVIAIVAAFGTMIPAAHEQPVWPFAMRFSLGVLDASPALHNDALFSGIATLAQVTRSPAPAAPDFELPAAQGDVATLGAQLRHGGVLLVFATLPQSQARLDQLRQWSDALHQAGIAIVVISDAPAIRDTYALYERRPQLEDEAPAAHIEFLIDRNGYIRARWRPGDTPDWTQLPALQREIAAMTHLEESAPAVAPNAHVHEG